MWDRSFPPYNLSEKEIVFVDLTEKITSCFYTEDFKYKLTVKIGGKTSTCTINTNAPLTLTEYNSMVLEALGGRSILQWCRDGYNVRAMHDFYCSKARTRILGNVQKPKKERCYI